MVEPDLHHTGMQPEVFPSLFLDVGDLGKRRVWKKGLEMLNLTKTTHLKVDLGLEILFLAEPDLFLAMGDL